VSVLRCCSGVIRARSMSSGALRERKRAPTCRAAILLRAATGAETGRDAALQREDAEDAQAAPEGEIIIIVAIEEKGG
jgi:hypothetical protein